MCVVVYAGDWVHKYALSLRKRKNDCVVLTPENSGLLAVDNAGCFVSILREDDFHVFMGKYRVRVHCRDTRYRCKGSSRKEMANYDVIDTVRCFPGDRHNGGVTVLLIGLPDVLVRQSSLRAEDYSGLHGIYLVLARNHKADEIEKFRVLWVDDAKLLIQGMDDSVSGCEGVVVDNGDAGGGAAVNGFKRLLLTFISG